MHIIEKLIRFLLNNEQVETTLSPGITLLDYIRYHHNLKGTKIGCREGDCGACTVLVGEIKDDKVFYKTVTSCLMALGAAAAKHIVTVEGLNVDGLNVIQQAFTDEGASQCGFCTPGFVVSLAGYCISDTETNEKNITRSIDGNICRCTGYKSIERAAARINNVLDTRRDKSPLSFAIENNFIPPYFQDIKTKLSVFQLNVVQNQGSVKRFLGGGTDLYVQQHEKMPYQDIELLSNKAALKYITVADNKVIIGGATTVTDIAFSKTISEHFKDYSSYIKLVSSTQIRNMATVAGNFVNASPIGDLTIFFMVLHTSLKLSNGDSSRNVNLKEFYKGYKQIDKTADEFIEAIHFELPGKNTLFNFEKVSKRTHLDIASVNTAILLEIKNNVIVKVELSAGGVGPIPLYLHLSSQFLQGKKIESGLLSDLFIIIDKEISPISDARGSAAYKTLLLKQLIKAHFVKLFPEVDWN